MITKTFKLTVATDTKKEMRKEEARLSMIYGAEEIKALEQQPCDDCISRQAAIDEIEYELEMINSALDSITLNFDARERLRQRRGEAREILNSIQELPFARPKTGKWVDDVAYYDENGCPCIVSRCNQCGEANPKSNYCPNCGAEMEVNDESSD